MRTGRPKVALILTDEERGDWHCAGAARLETTRDAAGQTIGARFTEEQRFFRLAPLPFAPEATPLSPEW